MVSSSFLYIVLRDYGIVNFLFLHLGLKDFGMETLFCSYLILKEYDHGIFNLLDLVWDWSLMLS